MVGYVRQAEADIQDNEFIMAEDLNTEYDAIEAAFHQTTGHVHDGTTGGGAPISYNNLIDKPTPVSSTDNGIARFDGTTGNLQDSSATIYDNGNLTLRAVGSGNFVDLTLYRATSTSITGIGRITFRGLDSSSVIRDYAYITGVVQTGTAGSFNGRIDFSVPSGGVFGTALRLDHDRIFSFKPFNDTDFKINDNADTTKLIQFEASGITTGNTRVITMADADVNLGLVNTAVQPGDLSTVATTGAAEDVSYDNSTSGLIATDAQSAIDELKMDLLSRVKILKISGQSDSSAYNTSSTTNVALGPAISIIPSSATSNLMLIYKFVSDNQRPSGATNGNMYLQYYTGTAYDTVSSVMSRDYLAVSGGTGMRTRTGHTLIGWFGTQHRRSDGGTWRLNLFGSVTQSDMILEVIQHTIMWIEFEP